MCIRGAASTNVKCVLRSSRADIAVARGIFRPLRPSVSVLSLTHTLPVSLSLSFLSLLFLSLPCNPMQLVYRRWRCNSEPGMSVESLCVWRVLEALQHVASADPDNGGRKCVKSRRRCTHTHIHTYTHIPMTQYYDRPKLKA